MSFTMLIKGTLDTAIFSSDLFIELQQRKGY